jgi:hypothetical protein
VQANINLAQTPQAWYLGPIGYSVANPNDAQPYLYKQTSPTSIVFETYFYKITKNGIGQTISPPKWAPFDPFAVPSGEYAYLGQIQPLTVTITGPNSLNINQSGTFTANVSGGSSPYTYQWSKMYECGSGGALAPADSTGGNNGNGQGNGNGGGNGNGNGHNGDDIGPTVATCWVWYPIGTNSASLTTSSSSYTFQLKVVVTDAAGSQVSATKRVILNGASGASFGDEVAFGHDFKLEQNNPNPFNPSTTIRYALPAAGAVSLKIYNTAGQLVRTLVNEDQAAGERQIVWDGKSSNGQEASSGLYFYRLEANGHNAMKRMMLLK